MSFYRRISYFLVHALKMNNADAKAAIEQGKVEIDGEKITENIILKQESEIRLEGKVVREAKQYVYLRFYKPVGYESTLSPKVENTLAPFFKDQKGLSIAGRLDKDSEGLLLLSNNGKWVENITNPKFEKEKEYIVELDKEPTEQFAEEFAKGINIGYHVTKPCVCEILDENKIRVKLKEGKNRQIRKMCSKLGYNVLTLKRIKIDQISIANLKPGEFDFITI